MNSKKAKRLRQLVRVMQDKGVVDKEWETNGSIKHALASELPSENLTTTKYQSVNYSSTAEYAYQSVLKPECGKAVYNSMKKRVK